VTVGQYMTPEPVARLMADMFEPARRIRLLEPSVGRGALVQAMAARWGRLDGVAYELDPAMRPALAGVRLVRGDYLALPGDGPYTHAILNPPYAKIGARSEARRHCRAFGLETVNLYTAFVGKALTELAPRGQLVAIVPRSFCNGPYHRRFREFVLARAAITRLHLFDTRDTFDGVLQENVIVVLRRGVAQGDVRITTSGGADRRVPFAEVVRPGDPQRFVHVAIDPDPLTGTHRLADLGIDVSTGPVVDFRLREHLVERGRVPLLSPQHLDGAHVRWPSPGKRPNAIRRNAATERWLLPAGTYTIVRRLSSKEERRRVVAAVVRPEAIGRPAAIGFENHLNVFHAQRRGLSPALAWGLYAYLSSADVDAHLRRFSGHTQVNAADLRALPYPSRAALVRLGKRFLTQASARTSSSGWNSTG
jgi:adenine-specific DNA-methyltransferase